MHLPNLASKATRPALFVLSAAFCAAGLALTARAETRVALDLGLNIGVPAPIVVEQPQPQPVVERVVVSPGPGYVWIGGHHAWRHGQWVWIRGEWRLPPQSGARYVEGRWDGPRHWIEGHWEIAPQPAPVVEYVVEAPPPPRTEVIVAQPSPNHVWISGYWVWRGHRHEWVAGRWVIPPHHHAVWVAPRWERRNGSYVFIEGTWR